MSRDESAEAYGTSSGTARSYMRMYRDAKGLPPKSLGKVSAIIFTDLLKAGRTFQITRL